MTKTLTLNPVSISIPWTYDKTGFPANVKDDNSLSYNSSQLTSGTGAGKANLKYSAQLIIAGGANTTLNLSALIDTFGDTLNFVRIKEFYLELNSITTASSIKVGGAVSNAFAGIWQAPGTANNDTFITLNNGVSMHFGVDAGATGFVVGTNVNLEITNNDSTNSATVNICIVGCDS